MLKQFITEVSICQHFYQNFIIISIINAFKCFKILLNDKIYIN